MELLKNANALAATDPTCAYELGKLYEKENNKRLACAYYATAMHKRHQEASERISSLAQAGDPDAQYSLGYTYYHSLNQVNSAIHWCLLAADKQHANAIAYLTETKFNAAQYNLIARKYREGQEIKKNVKLSVYFFEKANTLNSTEAALGLGALYESGDQGLQVDLKLAFNYYTLAALRGHKEALKAMERLIKELNDAHRWFKLGQIYGQSFNDPTSALRCFKISADQGSESAQSCVITSPLLFISMS